MGREEEGSSSNRPELVAFLLALLDKPIEEPLLYLCDNQSLLKAVNRWIGEGTATFLVKVKAHRGEPANEGACILADKAISDLKVGKEFANGRIEQSSHAENRAMRQGK